MFASGRRTIRLTGRSAEVIAGLLPLLDQGASSSELLASVPADARPLAGATLRALSRQGLLLETSPGPFDVYLPLFSGPKVATPVQRTVLVIGDGPLPLLCRRLVRTSGHKVVGARSPSRAVLSGLAKFDLVVFCAAHPMDQRSLTVNDAALAQRVRWLRATACQQFALVGPAVVPFSSACYRCLIERASASMGVGVTHGLWTRLENDDALATRYCAAAPLVLAMASAMAAWESIRLLVDERDSLTVGAQWSLDATTGMTRLEPVLRMPRCSACGVQGPSPTLWSPIHLPAATGAPAPTS
jgi:bacteriocin biosynthesis cyclodehydratase domain-containing protein